MGEDMGKTSNWLVHDHKQYDAALAQCEEIAEEGLWDEALRIYKQFVENLKLQQLVLE